MVFHTFQHFSYIVAVSFIGERNQSTQRKPQIRHKSLTNLSHNVVLSTPQLSGIQTPNVSPTSCVVVFIVFSELR